MFPIVNQETEVMFLFRAQSGANTFVTTRYLTVKPNNNYDIANDPTLLKFSSMSGTDTIPPTEEEI